MNDGASSDKIAGADSADSPSASPSVSATADGYCVDESKADLKNRETNKLQGTSPGEERAPFPRREGRQAGVSAQAACPR
ncbi:hypothetical protein [Streptomyces sp. NPDC007991]|uniref:hypothetical protein n=1 Tax=Streptomyces sp. NPDC007991 TaxID=3364803 RepID=UPI0036E181A6